MSDEEKQRDQEAPELGDIGDQLKKLGRQLQQAVEKAGRSEEAKKINADVAEAYESVKESAKSGQLAEDVKREIHDALVFFNTKLDDFLKNEEDKKG